MHFWLVVGTLIVWFWLACSTFYGWLKGYFGWFTALGTLFVFTALSVTVVLVYGPYWEVVYRTVLQPG